MSTLELVHDLAARLERGGDEATRAARALGLLLERSKLERPDGDPAELVALVGHGGPLSPRAIHAAIDLLIAEVGRDPRAAGAAWALGKSFEPRIVPHLEALRARTAGRADALAVEAADAIASFYPMRHDPPPRVHAPDARLALDGDADLLQRVPGSDLVLVSDRGRAVEVVDPADGRVRVRVPLSPSFAGNPRIRTWCLSADGTQAAVFGAGGAGSLVDLATGHSADLTPPPVGDLDHWRYRWDERLQVACGDVTTHWELADGDEGFAARRWLDVRRQQPGWVAELDALRPLRSYVLRTEPAEHRAIAYDFREAPGSLVVTTAPTWFTVPAPRFVPELAYGDGRLYLRYDREIHAIDGAGRVTDVFAAPADLYLRAIDTVAGALVVAAGLLDAPASSVLLRYAR